MAASDKKSRGGSAKYLARGRQVIDAAAAVFAEKGYHGTSTGDIADRLGIRQASLYYYARSKESLLEEVCRIGVEGFVQNAQAIAEGDRPALEKLRAVIAAHIESLGERPDYVRTFLNCRGDLPAPSRRRVGRTARKYEKIIEGILQAGAAGGELAAGLNCRLATLALLGMCNSVPGWLGRETTTTLKAIEEQFARIFLGGVGAAGEDG